MCAHAAGGARIHGHRGGFGSDTVVIPAKILLVQEIQADSAMRSVLGREGCEIHESPLNGMDRIPLLGPYCLVLFNVKHPAAPLLAALRSWRDAAPQTALVVIGNRTSSAMRLAVLEAGAAAYLRRPASPPELTARIRAAARRIHAEDSRIRRVAVDGRIVDVEAHSVSTLQGQVHLTATECDILRYLFLHINRTVPFSDLVAAVWGSDPQKGVHSLRRFIRELRQKLESNPHQPKYLVTEPTIGYRFQTNPEHAAGAST